MKSRDYLHNLKATFANLNYEAMDDAILAIRKTWQSGGQIITMGNGGSSLTALHFINDWNKSIYLSSGISFRGRTLLDNIGLVMSYANDISFEQIFAEQLKNILRPEDLVIGISGSGNSKNVINGILYANSIGAKTIGLCGFQGGELKNISQIPVWVNVQDMQLVEDIHAIFGHIVMKALCEK